MAQIKEYIICNRVRRCTIARQEKRIGDNDNRIEKIPTKEK